MTPAPQQAPKEHCDHEGVCGDYAIITFEDDIREHAPCIIAHCPHDTRSRPHPAPAFKRCCDSCINVPCKVLNRVPCLAQEKQENVCEENGCTDIENCDEICQHSRLFSPLQMQEAKDAAARQAREEVLNEFKNYIESWHKDTPLRQVILNKIESLRSTQHPGQEE